MNTSDQMQISATSSTTSGDDQAMYGVRSSDLSEKRRHKRPYGLSITVPSESVAATSSGLTPSLDRLGLRPSATGCLAETDDEFTTVSKKQFQRKENLVIDVAPATLCDADRVSDDLCGRQLLRTYTRNRDMRLVNGKARVLQDPNKKLTGANLLKGFDKADKPGRTRLQKPKFSLKWFLDYLHENSDLLEHQPNFICAVSTLRLLICACYEQQEVREWTIYARKRDGIWYLSEGWKEYDDEVSYEVKYAARMFEILCTGAKNLKDAAKSAKHFLRHEKTYQVWLAQLGEHRLLYSGDVDCVDSSGRAVELKAMTRSRWTSKLRRTWAQVHLMGSEKVVVGYLDCRADRGVSMDVTLNGTEEISAESLKPKASATWRTEICNACLDKILTSLKSEAFFQDEGATYKLTHDRRERKVTAERSTIELPIDATNIRNEHQHSD